MLSRLAFPLAALMALSACNPGHNFTPSSSQPSRVGLQGVWLKKSVADNFRNQSAAECGSLVATTPTAFRVEGDGSLMLMADRPTTAKSIKIGKMDAQGALTSPGLFKSFVVMNEVLLAQSEQDEKLTPYIRSNSNEVTGVFAKIEACIAHINHQATLMDLENQAVLAKNKIQLARQKASGLDKFDRAMAVLLTGTAWAIYQAEQMGFDDIQLQVARVENELSTALVTKVDNAEVRAIGQEFVAFRNRLAERLPQNARWKGALDRHDLIPEKDLLGFDGSYDVLKKSRAELGPMRDPHRALGEVHQREFYALRPGGTIQLTVQEKAELQSLLDRYEAQNPGARARYLNSELTYKQQLESVAKSKFSRRATGVAFLVAIAGAELYTLWQKSEVQAKTELVAKLVDLSDEDLRAEIRKKPEYATLLIQTGNVLKQ